MQHAATHRKPLQHTLWNVYQKNTSLNTMQHTAQHCNTLQHTLQNVYQTSTLQQQQQQQQQEEMGKRDLTSRSSLRALFGAPS